MIKASKLESQIIYYCKLWFEMPNTDKEITEGLKIIIADACALEPEWVNNHHVYRHLLNITFKFVPQGLFRERLLNLFKYQGDTIDIKYFIKQLYGEIQRLRIMKDNEVIVELEEVDYSVLPKRTTGLFGTKRSFEGSVFSDKKLI